MARPYRCPVCGGVGMMPQSFYNPSPFGPPSTTGGEMRVPCRACGGRGIVWEPMPQPDTADINQFEKALKTNITWEQKPVVIPSIWFPETNSAMFTMPAGTWVMNSDIQWADS